MSFRNSGLMFSKLIESGKFPISLNSDSDGVFDKSSKAFSISFLTALWTEEILGINNFSTTTTSISAIA